ncbi:MAG: tRNA preQ1(34) S-adenosylmethionine ribosyltransferase-isomerase QueA [Candidatus Sulfotelmatobacter sp.]
MLVSDFDFHLPEELIAQEPLAARDASRMLHLRRNTGQWFDRQFRDFPDLLRPGDLVVFNNTRVFPARLYGRRAGARAQSVSPRNPAARDFLHGRIEVLLTRQLSADPNDWECLVRPGRKIGVGERLYFGEHDELQAEVLARAEFGERRIRFQPLVGSNDNDFFAALDRIGHVPLPPYIPRLDSSRDRERYQTVYAAHRGSVAAPTAGLHFTPEVLDRIRQRGVETAEITLHVGLGTFQPIRVERVEDHPIHSEPYSVSPAAALALNQALRQSRRIIAIGTTTVRALEHAARQREGTISAASSAADIFIYPGFEFKIVQAILTNFHLPQSSLLMLVSAFGGQENTLRTYQHAVSEKYRFYSYGDCMFIE